MKARLVVVVILLSLCAGCMGRERVSPLYVLEELEAASGVKDPEERVTRLDIFTANHPDHPYRTLGYQRVFETLAVDIGDPARAADFLTGVLAREQDVRVRGDLLYTRFSYLWGVNRSAAASFARELVEGPERYYRLFFYLALNLGEDESREELAGRCFAKAGELAPAGMERSQVLGEYGTFLEAHGRADEALELLRESTEYAFANEALGRILWDRGEREEAVDAYLRLAALVPSARRRVGVDSLFALVYPDARDLDERILATRVFDGVPLPDHHFYDIEGREYWLGRLRGSPLVLFAFSPT